MFNKKTPEVPEEPKKLRIVGEAKSIHDIDNFFKHYISPALVEAKIERKVALQMRGQKGLPVGLISIAIMLLIIGAVAYSIVNSTSANSQCQATLMEIAKRGGSVDAGVVTTAQTATNDASKQSTPLSGLLPATTVK